MHVALTRERAVPTDRSTDRLVALWSVAAAMAFLVAALATLAIPAVAHHGLWLPIHLVLAGSATAAITGVMPFFVAAFAAAQPADPRVRFAGLAAVVLGAALVAIGHAGELAAGPSIAVAGGLAFIAGIALTGVATVQPLRRALGPSRGLVSRAYLTALAFVATGAALATLFLAGWPPVADAWLRLKPAHAWLNLVGFASLVIAATLIHFFPTVVGTRIGSHASGRVAILGVATGAALVPVGYASGIDIAGRAGAGSTFAGAVGLALYVIGRWRTRATWTTDPTWHRFVIGGLLSAVTWFVFGVTVAAGRILVAGVDPAAWAMDTLVAPLVVGWVGTAVLASASHLLPAIGPGDQAAHARQRGVLGRVATARLVALNAGVGGLVAGALLGQPVVTQIGTVLVAGGFLATAALVARSVQIGVRPGISARP
jgi:nitrite reductase (NO-forming)